MPVLIAGVYVEHYGSIVRRPLPLARQAIRRKSRTS